MPIVPIGETGSWTNYHGTGVCEGATRFALRSGDAARGRDELAAAAAAVHDWLARAQQRHERLIVAAGVEQDLGDGRAQHERQGIEALGETRGRLHLPMLKITGMIRLAVGAVERLRLVAINLHSVHPRRV